MVCKRLDSITRCYQEGFGAHKWSCYGIPEFTLE